MNYLQEYFPRYDCDEFGNVFKDGKPAKVFKSNKYLQVLLFDTNNNRRVCGVHTVVAMKYLDYFDGCIVHHKDNNQHNNSVSNLVVMSRTEHASLHGYLNIGFKTMNLGKPAWNRGLKMSEEFCKHCSEGAKRRKTGGFQGNQYIDRYGNKRI